MLNIYGPPGSGKTYYAREEKEKNKNLFFIETLKIETLSENYGVHQNNIDILKNILKYCIKKNINFIVIDEADYIFKNSENIEIETSNIFKKLILKNIKILLISQIKLNFTEKQLNASDKIDKEKIKLFFNNI